MKPEDVIADRTRPYTGAEYMQSLRDGREVYIDGERVADVTTHPALRNSVRSIARLYDALHDPKQRDVLTCPTDTGSGGYTHRFFRVPRSREDLRGAQAAIAAWSRMTYGWMGRTPDYKAAYSNTLGGNAEYYGPYAGNARAWYKRAQETVPFMNHAIVNPPIDRHKPAEQVKDVYVSVQKETDGGIIVSGAKVVATSAAITHYNFMGQSSKTATEDLDMSLMFMVPIDAPGLKLICRTSYEKAALRNGSPYDYPLSSRFDENDAIFILDHVFVPWEDVFIYRDPARVLSFYPALRLHARLPVPGLHALRGEARFHLRPAGEGAALHRRRRGARQSGAAGRGDRLAQPVLVAVERDGERSRSVGGRRGAAQPARRPGVSRVRARRLSAHQGHRRAHGDVGADLSAVLGEGFRQSGDRAVSAAICPRLARHRVQGAHQDHEAPVGRGRHRVRRPARAIRTQLRRRLGGHPRADTDRRASAAATSTAMEALVDQCMADYDENGWTGETWVDPGSAAS